MVKFCIIPAYLFYEENGFAVPRVPLMSSEWSRLFHELSAYVWYALIGTFVCLCVNESIFPVHVGLFMDYVTLPFQSAKSKALMKKIHQYNGFGSFYGMIQQDRRDIAYIVPKYLLEKISGTIF